MVTAKPKKNTKPRKLPRQQRSIENVERILKAAAEVLEEYGYDHLKTVTIAERAGASVGSVYQYFPNKHAILTMLSERWLEKDNNALEEVEGRRDQYESVIDEFIDLTKIMIANYKEQRGLISLVSLRNNIPELYELEEAHDKQFARRLKKIIDRHDLNADDDEKLALAGYYTIILDAVAISVATETPKRAELKTKFLLNSVQDLFERYL